MYLNDHSDHRLSLKRSTVYSQLLRMKRLYYESEHLVLSQILLYHHFTQRHIPPQMIYEAWTNALVTTMEDQTDPPSKINSTDNPFELITTYNRGTLQSKRSSKNFGLI